MAQQIVTVSSPTTGSWVNVGPTFNPTSGTTITVQVQSTASETLGAAVAVNGTQEYATGPSGSVTSITTAPNANWTGTYQAQYYASSSSATLTITITITGTFNNAGSVYASGAWQTMTGVYVYASGSWQQVTGIYVYASGSWQQVT